MARKGKHGDGVYEDPSGSGIFWARWRGIDGRDKKKKVGTLTRAKDYRAKMVADVRDRILFPERYLVPEAGPAPWTLREAVDDYQANSPAKKGHSFWSDESTGRALVALWGDRIIDSIRPIEVRDWLTARRKAGRAEGTLNRNHGYLKRVCRRAIALGRAATDPTDGVKRQREGRRVPRYLLPEEEARLREQLVGRDWLAVELAYRTGMRREEQFGLAKAHVNLERRHIVLLTPKAGEQEIVHLNTRAVEILRELMDTDSPWVFPSTIEGKHRNSDAFTQDVFRPALLRARIPGFRWHDLRHTFASWLAIAGVDLQRIQQLMRHRSYAMTQIYAHLLPEHLQDAVERVAGKCPAGPNSSARVESSASESGDESRNPHQD